MKTPSFPEIQDGLRHTFCTFHYAKHHNTEELRHIMGNSPSVIDRFYKGAIGKVEVEKFWRIGPKAVDDQPSASAPLPTSGKGVRIKGR